MQSGLLQKDFVNFCANVHRQIEQRQTFSGGIFIVVIYTDFKALTRN